MKVLLRLLVVIAATTGSDYALAGDLHGRVLRSPAATAPRPAINRYRRSGTEARSARQADNCNCNPGLYSVVWLKADSMTAVTTKAPEPVMAQEGKRFVPSVLAVQVGTTVDFPNLDPFFHNVFSYSKPKRFDLGRYPKGESERVTFDKPGIVKIFCEIHASMRAYVHVLNSPFHAVSNEQGVLVISGVPDGDYELEVWQEGQDNLTTRVAIRGDSSYVEIAP
jgi:plastocyanin